MTLRLEGIHSLHCKSTYQHTHTRLCSTLTFVDVMLGFPEVVVRVPRENINILYRHECGGVGLVASLSHTRTHMRYIQLFTALQHYTFSFIQGSTWYNDWGGRTIISCSVALVSPAHTTQRHVVTQLQPESASEVNKCYQTVTKSWKIIPKILTAAKYLL